MEDQRLDDLIRQLAESKLIKSIKGYLLDLPDSDVEHLIALLEHEMRRRLGE